MKSNISTACGGISGLLLQRPSAARWVGPILVSLAVTACGGGGSTEVEGKGVLVFAEDGKTTAVDVTKATLARVGTELQLDFTLGGAAGEGHCDVMSIPLEGEYGRYRLVGGGGRFTAGDSTWSVSPQEGGVDFQEEGLALRVEGILVDEDSIKGPTYQLSFIGDY